MGNSSRFLVLVGVTAAALVERRRCPYLLVGWLWYLVMLLPVIGLVQVGNQAALADRFTYLPQIGLCIALVWTAADACRSWPYRRWVYSVTSALVLVVLMGCAWRQTSYWHDSETLWNHTLACTSRNNVAHDNLGRIMADRGRSTRRSPSIGRPWKSSPMTWASTTTSATPWPAGVDSTRRWHIIERLWKSNPTTWKLTTTWATLFSDVARSTRRLPITRRPWKSSLTMPMPTPTLILHWPAGTSPTRP